MPAKLSYLNRIAYHFISEAFRRRQCSYITGEITLRTSLRLNFLMVARPSSQTGGSVIFIDG